jgi:hypothetical protein
MTSDNDFFDRNDNKATTHNRLAVSVLNQRPALLINVVAKLNVKAF